MAPSQEEKWHTNGAQEITKSVNRWTAYLPTVSRWFLAREHVFAVGLGMHSFTSEKPAGEGRKLITKPTDVKRRAGWTLYLPAPT